MPPTRDRAAVAARLAGAVPDARASLLAVLLCSPALRWPLAWLLVAAALVGVAVFAPPGDRGVALALRTFARTVVSLLVAALVGLVVVAVLAGLVAALLAVGDHGRLVYAHAKIAAAYWGLRWGTFAGVVLLVRRNLGTGGSPVEALGALLRSASPLLAAPLALMAVAACVLFARSPTSWSVPMEQVNPGLRTSVATQLDHAAAAVGRAELGDSFCAAAHTSVQSTDGVVTVTTARSDPATVLRVAAAVHDRLDPFVRAVEIHAGAQTYRLDRAALGPRSVADDPVRVAQALSPRVAVPAGVVLDGSC